MLSICKLSILTVAIIIMIKINEIIQVNHSAQCFGTKLMSGTVLVHTGTLWSTHTVHLSRLALTHRVWFGFISFKSARAYELED